MKIIRKVFIKSVLLTLMLLLNLMFIVGCKEDEPTVDTSIPTSLVSSKNDITMVIGDVETISITATPSTASTEVTWYVEDDNIVSISNGVITALNEGTTTITAESTKKTSVKTTINVTVVKGKLEIKELPTSLVIDGTYQLNVDTTYGEVKYESLNTNIATVDDKGLVTGVSTGTVNIKVTAVNYPEKVVTVSFKVYSIPEQLTTANKTTEIFIGSSSKFNLSAKPSGSTNAVTWVSSNPNVLSVDKTGRITGISEGKATIKATSIYNSNVYFEREIIVKSPATSVEVTTNDETSAFIGETIQLSAQVFPSSVANTVTWKSPNESVATVDQNGLVTITGIGEVVITASSTVTPYINGSIKIYGLHDLLDEDEANVRYIITGVGEDASTSVNINYHADNTKTYIEYTLANDPEFTNAQIIIPSGKYLEELSEEYESPFVGRNVYSAEITGLTPGAKYIYRVNSGDGNVSDTYHFTTASGKGNNFSFLWLTDNHYHDAGASMGETYLYAEEVIKQAQIMRPELSFVFDTGDMIDRGGSANIWDLMFSKRMTLKDLPLVGTTGNHELYINGTGQTTNRFHAAYNALPKNSVDGKIGTSCYFFYNDVLFILFESVHPSSYNEQLKWLDDVLRTTREQNSARLIVMGTHKPIHSENASYASQDRDENIMALCDKYSVDLVLTGHYHSEEVFKDYYEGTFSDNPLLGTNYMIGKASRLEGSQATGYIVDVIDGTTLKVTRMNHLGQIISTWEFNTKKEEPISEEAKNASKEDIFNSLTWNLNKSLNNITFNWSKLAYGNVSKITVKEVLRGYDFEEVYIINEAYTKLVIDKLSVNYDGVYEVIFYFNDGTTMGKTITIKNDSTLEHSVSNIDQTSAVINLVPASPSLDLVIKTYDVYVNGVFVESIKYLDGLYPIQTYKLTNLESNTEYTVEFRAINASKEIMFSNSVTFKTK